VTIFVPHSSKEKRRRKQGMGQRTTGAKNPLPARKIQYKQLSITC